MAASVLAIVPGLLVAVGPADAASRPDLRITAVTAPAKVVAGASLTVRATVRNTGVAKAGKSTTTVLLSADRRASGSDRSLATVRTKAVRGGKKVAVRATGTVRVPAGRWYVLVCADATGKVRERKEGNNCRASSAPMQVSARPTPKPPTPPGELPTLPQPPNPIDVEYAVNTRGSISALVPLEGGSVSATGPDGTIYRLSVPAGALASPTRIRLTPLTSMVGAPTTGPVLGVETAPQGLALRSPATLTITPAEGSGPEASSAFMVDADGRDFRAHPASFTDTAAHVDLTHLSTIGIAGTLEVRGSSGSVRWPRRPQSQLEAATAEVLAGRSPFQLGSTGPTPADAMTELWGRYEKDVIQPGLQSASDCAQWQATRSAVASTLALESAREALGAGSMSAQTQQLIRDADAALTACSQQLCTSGWPIDAAVIQLGLLGRYLHDDADSEIDRLLPTLEKCLVFELEFSSTYDEESFETDGTTHETRSIHLEGGTVMTLRLNQLFLLRGREGDARVSGEGQTRLGTFDVDHLVTEEQGWFQPPRRVRQTTGSRWDPGLASAQLDLDLNAYRPTWANAAGWVWAASTTGILIRPDSTALNLTNRADPLAETVEVYTPQHGTSEAQRTMWLTAHGDVAARVLYDFKGRVPLRRDQQQGRVLVDQRWITEDLCEDYWPYECALDQSLHVRLSHTPAS